MTFVIWRLEKSGASVRADPLRQPLRGLPVASLVPAQVGQVHGGKQSGLMTDLLFDRS